MRRLGCAALAALLAAGCGFQLRTWDFAETLQRIRIEADDSVDVQRELTAALRSAGVQVVDAEADMVLQLAAQERGRRSVATSGAGLASEFELSLQVEFGVAGGDGRELAAAEVLRSERSVRLQANLLGGSAEQALVFDELRGDIVGRMLRIVAALAQQAGPSSSASSTATEG